MIFFMFLTNLFCVGARQNGLGSPATALINDPLSTFSNPANISPTNLSFSYIKDALQTQHNFFQIKKSNLALLWLNSTTTIEITTENEVLGTTQLQNNIYFLNYTIKNSPLPIGFSVKSYSRTFGSYNLKGIGFDIGTGIITKNFGLGLAIKDVGNTKLKGKSYWSDASIYEVVYSDFLLGFNLLKRYNLVLNKRGDSFNFEVNFISDIVYNSFYKTTVSGGIEIYIHNLIGFRFGWRKNFTTGISLNIGSIRFDYAFVESVFGDLHNFSIIKQW